MHFRYMKTTLILVLILALAAGQASAFSFGKHGKSIKGSGDLETRELELDNFDKTDIGGAFDLHVTLGKKQMVKITIDDNLWDNLEVEVDGHELQLDWDKS